MRLLNSIYSPVILGMVVMLLNSFLLEQEALAQQGLIEVVVSYSVTAEFLGSHVFLKIFQVMSMYIFLVSDINLP